MKIVNLSLTITLFFFLSLTASKVRAQSPNPGVLFTVNNNGDSLDVNPGDGICADSSGQCTLRAALQEANSTSGGFLDSINFALPVSSVIDLTLGRLLITKNIAIVGPGSRRLTVQRQDDSGTPDFRIFTVPPNAGNNIIIRGLTIKNGRATDNFFGGGMFIQQGNTVNLTDVAISNNWAVSGGGIANAGTVNLTRSLINSNTVSGQGGGVINLDSSSVARITNSTITDNSATEAGAIYNSGNLLLVNNTITHNSANNVASSTVNVSGGTVNVLNTIIGNSSNTLTVNTLSGAFNSLGNNLITDARGSTGFTNGVNGDQVSDNNVINPLLGDLTDNGGGTDTRALQAGSPAINKGNSCVRTASCSITPLIRLSSDQRTNHTRQVGKAVDIGAFEAGATPVTGSVTFTRVFGADARFFVGSLTILTNARTGEKLYRVVNIGGGITFQNLVLGDVYILEVRSKRRGFFTEIHAFDNFILLPSLNDDSDPESIILLEEK